MMNRSYKALAKQCYRAGDFSIEPIRYEDRLPIMKWRNEQLYHLRQQKPLTAEDQERYFLHTIPALFTADFPPQLLFSYLQDGQCIGYGGLVHINWVDKYAEISFLMNTALEEKYFQEHWVRYLGLIEQVAFAGLGLHKIFTYAFDLRPRLYAAVEAAGFKQEAVLKEHCFFEGKYIDVIIHTKINA
jgi:RimJ/RimL family protein N-acetyltransferase